MHRVLIITYYWPPAGGPGVQRWLKFIKYLREFGVDPVVYVPQNPYYVLRDPSLLEEVPGGITVLTRKIWEPYQWASRISGKKTKRISSGVIHSKDQSFLEKAMLWIRGNYFIPDSRIYWVRPSVNFLSEYLKKEKIDTIITTGPPHSVHLIGLHLKERIPLNWVADFRDPWTSIGYHSKLRLGKAARRKHKNLEKQVLTTADQIIVTSATTQKEFNEITDTPVTVITNGYDGVYKGSPGLDDKFTLSHIGSLLSGRNPEVLWQVLGELLRENKNFREAFQLQFIGVVSKDVLSAVEKHGIMDHTRVFGYVDHARAMEFQHRAQVLLLVEIDSEETQGIIPGKLFEYLAARRPVIAVGPDGWEAGDILKQTNAGVAFDYHSRDALKEVILDYFKLYEKGGLTVNSRKLEQYSRRSLTAKLAELLLWE